MHIRYFEKRPGAWHMDFKTESGQRLRPYAGTTEAAARKAAPGVLAGAMAAAALPKAPTPAMVPAGPTCEAVFRAGLTVRTKWIDSKDQKSIEGSFYSLGINDLPVAALTRDKVRSMRAEWLKEPGKRKGSTLSSSTINHRLSMLSSLLELADLPPHTVKHQSVKGNGRVRRITEAEVQEMARWCLDNAFRAGVPDFADLITLGLETGARAGELLGMTWANVDLTEPEPSVVFRDTKNSLSRSVPLLPASATILALRRALPAPFAGLKQDRYTALWESMRRAMGLEDDTLFVFHGLRHECLTRLGNAGVSALLIADIAGHESLETTKRYVHISTEAKRAAMTKATK